MEKEQARGILESWINWKIKHSHINILPIKDEVVSSTMETKPGWHKTLDEQSKLVGSGHYEITEYTFKHLIKIAYDLEDKKP